MALPDSAREILSQARLLVLVPISGGFDVDQRVIPDVELPTHAPNRALKPCFRFRPWNGFLRMPFHVFQTLFKQSFLGLS